MIDSQVAMMQPNSPSGGSIINERSYIRELHDRSDAINLSDLINQLWRKWYP